MFEVRNGSVSNCYISDGNNNYLHSDGSVLSCAEFWPTKEQAQAVLDKYPPPRVWKHGDVFTSKAAPFICLMFDGSERLRIFHLGSRAIGNSVSPKYLGEYLEDATFLFNVKDKLPC